MIGIYCIRNIKTNDVYVGASVNIEDRWRRHRRDLKQKKHHSIILQRAYEKYGKESFVFEVLLECTKEDLIEKENRFLAQLVPKYNICKYANSTLGRKYSDETRKKHREYALKNNIRPPDSIWKSKSKSVIMLDYHTLKPIKTFFSASEACRFLGKDSTFASTITSCCNNKRYSAFGFRWVLKKADIPSLRNKIPIVAWNKGLKIDNNKKKKVKQYDLEMNFIKEWDSVKEAEQIFGKGISNCALGKSNTSNGFIWRYK